MDLSSIFVTAKFVQANGENAQFMNWIIYTELDLKVWRPGREEAHDRLVQTYSILLLL